MRTERLLYRSGPIRRNPDSDALYRSLVRRQTVEVVYEQGAPCRRPLIFILLINMLISQVRAALFIGNGGSVDTATDSHANSIRAEMPANYHNCDVFVSGTCSRKFNLKFGRHFQFRNGVITSPFAIQIVGKGGWIRFVQTFARDLFEKYTGPTLFSFAAFQRNDKLNNVVNSSWQLSAEYERQICCVL